MKYKIKSHLRVVMHNNDLKSLKSVEDITGLSKPTIVKIDNGDVLSMSLGKLLTVCDKLNCTFPELIELIDIKAEENN
ncbi:helix-turn-helix transcriptional regulator [Clostridium sp. 19966]|uniref:helix-turn-helix domain-containing protein n=1 Tax=Clostridium sp. 19966 TaxID=2768166 RepID=UPI0028DD94F7|nr:helix-turn-helix transcriptional regulator [Clostridium sp. 19966]MDT8718285.1 helix-turn-helix transcriptional regulator [Clostridium sp. 19966]